MLNNLTINITLSLMLLLFDSYSTSLINSNKNHLEDLVPIIFCMVFYLFFFTSFIVDYSYSLQILSNCNQIQDLFQYEIFLIAYYRNSLSYVRHLCLLAIIYFFLIVVNILINVFIVQNYLIIFEMHMNELGQE